MSYFFQLLINSVSLGSIYALTAIGYSLVYGVLELVNFAHGSVFMLGAFSYYLFAVVLALPWYVALPAALVATGLVGVAYERLALSPLRNANLPKFAGLICTLGVSITLQNAVFLIAGSNTRLFPTFFEGQFIRFGTLSVSYIQLLIVVISAVVLVLFNVFIKYGKQGLAMRTVAENAGAAELMGISVNKIVSFTFFLGSAMAAISGTLSCMSFRSLDITIGSSIAIKAFTATVLGGIGNFNGAVVGAFIIAISESFTAGYLSSDMRDLSSFVILILILIFRKNGLFGKAVQKKV